MRGRPFEPGNKMGRGRPRGSRNRRTKFAEQMDDHGEAIIKQCQVMALEKDPTAMRLCMDRLVPPCKSAHHRFRSPRGTTPADLVKAVSRINQQVARGHMSAQDGEAMARTVEIQRRAVETEDFERRLQVQEKEMAKLRRPGRGQR
jgi:hypothetical protein